MNIFHLNCNYIGTNLHKEMLEQLESINIKNEVFVPTYKKNVFSIQVKDNVTIVECFKKRDRFFFDYKQKKIFNSIQKIYNMESFECIHAYTLFTDGNCARKLSKKHKIPYVVAIRNTDVNVFFKKMLFLRKRGIKIMRDAAAIVFLSEKYKKNVFEKYIPPKYASILMKKSYIVPNGIDDFWHKNIYTEKNIAESLKRFEKKQVRIMFAGRIDKNKNILCTIKALQIMKDNGWNIKFTIVGTVKNKKVFEHIKHSPYCYYLETMQKEELINIYRENDIFVMPSHTETFGLVYAEAMSQGLPVIYTRNQGFDGQFNEGEIGHSVSDKSPIEVAYKIESCIKNYEKMSRNCLCNVNKFKWSDICEKYHQIYNTIIAE